jgi:hypothetical protein
MKKSKIKMAICALAMTASVFTAHRFLNGDIGCSSAESEELIDGLLWISHQPKTDVDEVRGLLLLGHHEGFGAALRMSTYRSYQDQFFWSKKSSTNVYDVDFVHMPEVSGGWELRAGEHGDGKCKAPAPFEYCLVVITDQGSSTYYSREELRMTSVEQAQEALAGF